MLGHKTNTELITEADPIANAQLGIFACAQQLQPAGFLLGEMGAF